MANDGSWPILLKKARGRISRSFLNRQRRGECVALDLLRHEKQFEAPLRASIIVIPRHRSEDLPFSTVSAVSRRSGDEIYPWLPNGDLRPFSVSRDLIVERPLRKQKRPFSSGRLTYGYSSSRDDNFDSPFRADDFRVRQFLGMRPPATEGTRW